jgi:hypothetical protein
MAGQPEIMFPTRKLTEPYGTIPADDPYVPSRSFRDRLRDQSLGGRFERWAQSGSCDANDRSDADLTLQEAAAAPRDLRQNRASPRL